MTIDTISGYNSNNIYTNGYGSGNDVSGAFGELDSDTAAVLQQQNLRKKNAQNYHQTVEGMKLDFSTKLMTQIGSARA